MVINYVFLLIKHIDTKEVNTNYIDIVTHNSMIVLKDSLMTVSLEPLNLET